MDISFILSADELYTLISLSPELSDAGERFVAEMPANTELTDLTSLIDKRLARLIDGGLAIAPVIRMTADAIARADSAEKHGALWEIHSPWVRLQCEPYAFKDGHFKLTPLPKKESAT